MSFLSDIRPEPVMAKNHIYIYTYIYTYIDARYIYVHNVYIH